MTTHASEKITSLTKHIEKIKNQLVTPPVSKTLTPESTAAYKQWCKIEISKAEATVARLKA